MAERPVPEAITQLDLASIADVAAHLLIEGTLGKDDYDRTLTDYHQEREALLAELARIREVQTPEILPDFSGVLALAGRCLLSLGDAAHQRDVLVLAVERVTFRHGTAKRGKYTIPCFKIDWTPLARSLREAIDAPVALAYDT